MQVKNGILSDAVTYSSIINGLCKEGRLFEGYLLFREMEKMGMNPNHVTYSTLIHYFLREGRFLNSFAL